MKFNNYTDDELIKIGVNIGKNVYISNTVIFNIPENIFIGDNTRIDSYCLIIAGKNSKITIGKNIHISAGCYLYGSSDDITIGDFSTISGRCSIYTGNDDYTEGYMTNPQNNKTKVSTGAVDISNNVIIGCNSVILPGVTLGEGTSAGSFSLIKKSTNPFEVIAGIPAKKIKTRKRIFI